jgi:DNA polymerase-3 subunit delta'
VYGHDALRARLLATAARGALPSSLLLHGPRGVGKQRLALWLGQALVCDGPAAARAGGASCGRCQHCRYADALAHPDLAWFFPRPRLKDADPEADDVRADYAEARGERAARHGLYAPSPGTEAIYVPTVRAIVQQAGMSAAMARRKVFVVGDAERMVAQEGADQAANAFLKLLEEPPADTTLLLTSSEPGALLPTIRSRVVSVRVPPLAPADVRAFLADPQVAAALAAAAAKAGDPPPDDDVRVRQAGGAPGALLGAAERGAADAEADRLLRAVLEGDRADRLRAAFLQGASKARGAYSDVLDALTVRLHAMARDGATPNGPGDPRPRDPRRALGAARAVDAVERAKARAYGNVNPQLVTAALVRELAESLR